MDFFLGIFLVFFDCGFEVGKNTLIPVLLMANGVSFLIIRWYNTRCSEKKMKKNNNNNKGDKAECLFCCKKGSNLLKFGTGFICFECERIITPIAGEQDQSPRLSIAALEEMIRAAL